MNTNMQGALWLSRGAFANVFVFGTSASTVAFAFGATKKAGQVCGEPKATLGSVYTQTTRLGQALEVRIS